MKSMETHRLTPMIAKYAFVYHFKSVTVKVAARHHLPSSPPQVANYVLGSDNETRNDLHHYHPTTAAKSLAELYLAYQSDFQPPQMNFYPPEGQSRAVVAFIVPTKQRLAYASDLDTAQVRALH
jgi:hypothetical protein